MNTDFLRANTGARLCLQDQSQHVIAADAWKYLRCFVCERAAAGATRTAAPRPKKQGDNLRKSR